MARFTRAELQALHGTLVDDLLGPGVRLLFVGINPSGLNAHETVGSLAAAYREASLAATR